ncbi:MAG TPA: DUF2232 domain-containing protein [Bacillota bacterium]|nr:DUF2232 domain-containing protein [Bacillota bacterium]
MPKQLNEVVVWVLAGLVTGLIAAASSGFPELRFFISLVWTAPIALIVVKYGLPQGVASVLIAGLVAGVVTGPVEGSLIAWEIGPLALVIGLLYKNRVPAARAMMICVLVSVLVHLTELGITYGQFSKEWLQVQKELTDQFIAAYKKAGVLDQVFPGLSETEIRTTVLQSLRVFFQLLPGFSVAVSTLLALTNYRLSHRYISRGGIALAPVLPFAQWRFPWYIIWTAILGLLGVLLGTPDSIILLSGENLLLVSGFFSLILGFSVTVNYLGRATLPGLLKWVLIVFLILNGIFSLGFILVLGLFDPIINFRRLGVKKAE